MFTDNTTWPGFVQAGNQNVDPGSGPSITTALSPGADTELTVLVYLPGSRQLKQEPEPGELYLSKKLLLEPLSFETT